MASTVTDQETISNIASSRSLSLKANFAWTLTGNVAYAGCQWGMLVVLAKLGSPEMVGQFALGLAVTAPVIMFFNLQLRGIQATDAKREYTFSDYLSLRLATSAFSLLTISSIVLVSGYSWETGRIVAFIGLAKAVESVSDITFGLLQQRERMDRISISMMLKGFLSLGAVGGMVYATGSVALAALTLAASWALVLVAYDLPNARLFLGKAETASPNCGARHLALSAWERRKRILRLAQLGLPLGVVMLMISLNTNIPRYFVERQFGAKDLGIFAALSYLMVAGSTVVAALGQSASPRLSRYFAAGELDQFAQLLLRLVLVGVSIGAAGVVVTLVAGRMIITLLYSSEFAGGADAFAWIMMAGAVAFVASFLGYGMTAARQYSAQAPLLVAVTLATLLSSSLLVEREGLVGAAISVLVGQIVLLIGSGVVLAQVGATDRRILSRRQ